MFEFSCFSEEVTNYNKLGTGRGRQKVVVVDLNKKILFIARILQNRPSTGVLLLDNKKIFYLNSRTLENQKVSLYVWSEELQICWQCQREKENIVRWLESARPEDVIVLAEFVAKESGLAESRHDPFFVILAKVEIEKRMRYLSLVQLQGLTNMMFPATERIAALKGKLMKLIMLFNGKEFLVVPLPEDGYVDAVVTSHPGFILFDEADSEEQAAIKIHRERQRRKAEWV